MPHQQVRRSFVRYIILRFVLGAEHVDDFVLDHFLHVRSCVAEVLAGIEVIGVLHKMLTDRRRKRNSQVTVDIDFADRKLCGFSELGFGNADCVGHGAAEFVDDCNLFLRYGRSAVQDDGEARKASADFFENVDTQFRILTGFELISAVACPDRDCERVDTRFGGELLHLVGRRELRVVRRDFYVVLDSRELAELRFDDDAVVVRVLDDLFRDSEYPSFRQPPLRGGADTRGSRIFSRLRTPAR